MQHPSGAQRKSRLDLDSDRFLTKHIYRCGGCGDVCYASALEAHVCREPAEAPGAAREKSSTEGADSVEMEGIDRGADPCPPVGPVRYYDEIYAIWRRNGFNRHPRQRRGGDAAPRPAPDASAASEKFSFSPYDNFF